MYLSKVALLIQLFALIAVANCSKNAQIIGGDIATDGQCPFQVSLQLNKNHVCGGSILDYTHILTAAHCVVWSDDTPIPTDMVYIRAGTNILGVDGQVRQAKTIYVHEKYRMNLNDVALVVLSEPLEFNDKVQPIKMDQEEVPVGVEVTIFGWGKTANDGTRSQVLKFATLIVLSMEQCDKKSGMGFKQIVCLDHPRGTGACQGDSGGPAVYKEKLIGVASLVASTCGTNKPDSYARVSLYYDWVLEKIALSLSL